MGYSALTGLCSEIWKMIQSEPEYAGKTTMFILPDFGRDSDSEAGRQWFSASPNGRCALAHHLVDGAGSGNSGQRHGRSPGGVDRSGSDFGFAAGALASIVQRQASHRDSGGVADEWVTQLLRQGDAKVFKKYSQMKLQMKREALKKLNRKRARTGRVFDTEKVN